MQIAASLTASDWSETIGYTTCSSRLPNTRAVLMKVSAMTKVSSQPSIMGLKAGSCYFKLLFRQQAATLGPGNSGTAYCPVLAVRSWVSDQTTCYGETMAAEPADCYSIHNAGASPECGQHGI